MEIKNGVLVKISDSDINKNGHLHVPECVTSIGYEACKGNKNLKSITLPSNLKHIDDYAFAWCDLLEAINIPNSVKSIGEAVFTGCTNLTSVTISTNITTISKWSFQSCSQLKTVLIPEGVTAISRKAFAQCTSLILISLPKSLKSIAELAFEECTDLTTISLPKGVATEHSIFDRCSALKTLVICDYFKSHHLFPKDLLKDGTIKIQADSAKDYELIKSCLEPAHFKDKARFLSKGVMSIQSMSLSKLYYCLFASPMAKSFSMKGLLQALPLELWGHIHSFLGEDYPYRVDAQKEIDTLPLPKEINKDSLTNYEAECDKIVVKYIKQAESDLININSNNSLSNNSLFKNRGNSNRNQRDFSKTEKQNKSGCNIM